MHRFAIIQNQVCQNAEAYDLCFMMNRLERTGYEEFEVFGAVNLPF